MKELIKTVYRAFIPAWRVCYFLRFEVTSFDCDYAAENDK